MQTSPIPISSSPKHPGHAAHQMEAAAERAYELYLCVASEYPGAEWDHITAPLKKKWLDADAAWHVAEYGVQA